MSLRTAYRCDAPSILPAPILDAAGRRVGDAEIALRTNPNTGALEFTAPLTWTGVRRYRHADGSFTRELRRPEQVKSESHLRGLQLLTATPDHPSLPDGTPVYLDARGGPDVMSPDGSALRPARDFEVGHVGDNIVDGSIGGYYVPLGRVSVTDLATQRRIAAGRTQTSLGYACLLDDAGGVWDGPHGPEEYDIEHILDHEDPRVQRAIDEGVLSTVERLIDGEVVNVPVIGPNHFAIAIWAGRGEALSEIVDFADPALAATGGHAARADAAHRNAAQYLRVVADAAPPATDTAVQRAAQTACVDRRADILPVEPPALAAFLAAAPLTGRYAANEPCATCGASSEWNPACPVCRANATFEWAGWVVPAPGSPGVGGIAFVAVDGLGLWWPTRAPDGAVVGNPYAFKWTGPAAPPQPSPVDDKRGGSPIGEEDEDDSEWIDDTAGLLVYDITDAATIATTEHSARQVAPSKFGRSPKFARFDMPNGVSFLLARASKADPWQVQSVRFPPDAWSPAEAKSWLKAVGLKVASFEPATAADVADAAADVVNDADDLSTTIIPETVSFVAPLETSTYAHPVRGSMADARFLPMRKISLPVRLADAAAALASAVKAPTPAKISDAMLEVELPEGSDTVALAAGMHALATALEKISGDMASMEGANAELGADYSQAMLELDAAKTKIDALEADAEVGRQHRLAAVVAIAKTVGLTDSDLAGKTADQVRQAAVTHKYEPKGVKHLDTKNVLEAMWTAIKIDAEKQPVVVEPVKPEPVAPQAAKPEPPVKPEPIKPVAAPRSDAAGDVVGSDAPRPKTSLSMHKYG